MPKQLKRLVGPTQLGITGTSESSLCTPAAGTQAVLKHIQATNTDATATHYLCVSIGADAAATRIVDQVAIAPNGEYSRWVTHVIAASEIVCASADATSKVTLTVNGDLYTLG